jgi:hypothetical protein
MEIHRMTDRNFNNGQCGPFWESVTRRDEGRALALTMRYARAHADHIGSH